MTFPDPDTPDKRARPDEKLERQAIYFRTLFDNLPNALAVLDPHGCVINVNHGFEELFGYTLADVHRSLLDSRVVPDHLMEEAGSLSRRVLAGEMAQAETVRQRKDGTLTPVRVYAFPITVDDRQIGSYVVYDDISESQQAHRRAAWEASHDSLTGLINRAEFEHRLAALLPAITPGVEHSLLYIDLDEFKVINDICGHRAGDTLLRDLTEKLREDIDGVGILARLGGDEFGALLRHRDASSAERLARQLMRTIAGFRFNWDGQLFNVGASIGVVGIDADYGSLPILFAAADAACYAAKERGGNRVQVYDPKNADIARRYDEMGWVSRLSEALETDRFVLYYQSISPLKYDKSPRKCEILLRYRADNGDIVSPNQFIPAAERYHLMPALDRWVVRKVFGGIRRELNTRGAGLKKLLAVNISGETIGEPHFRHFVREQFRRFQIPPGMICFEITETATIENLDQAISFINDMRQLGCTISLDDFGSGLSSFPYLKNLQVDYLKIDGAFVRNMATDPIDCAMVETINRVGKIMGVKTIAEFVELKEVAHQLRELGVDFAQGFSIHVPEPWRWASGTA